MDDEEDEEASREDSEQILIRIELEIARIGGGGLQRGSVEELQFELIRNSEKKRRRLPERILSKF